MRSSTRQTRSPCCHATAIYTAFALGFSLIAACSSSPSEAQSPSTRIDVALQSEDFGGVLSRVTVVASVDGTDVHDETFDPTDPNAFPRYVSVLAPHGGALLGLRVAGYLGSSDTESPVLMRLASTKFVDAQTRELVVRLDPRCLAGDPFRTFAGPVCVDPQTCITGRCEDSYVPPDALGSEIDGGDAAGDACSAGPLDAILGSGQSAFVALHDGDTLQLEKGPQGGHHLWLALRLRGFRQNGTTVRVTGAQVDGGAGVPTTAYAYVLDPDVEGYCRLTNLRFQVDVNGADYRAFLGQPLDVHVDIADTSGASRSVSATINVASTVAGQ